MCNFNNLFIRGILCNRNTQGKKSGNKWLAGAPIPFNKGNNTGMPCMDKVLPDYMLPIIDQLDVNARNSAKVAKKLGFPCVQL